jgi:hypothetical protein
MCQADSAEKHVAIAQQAANAKSQLAQAKVMEAQAARLTWIENMEAKIEQLKTANKDASFWERELVKMQNM